MRHSFHALLAALCLLANVAAAQAPASQQDVAVLRQSVQQFLRIQTTGLPGQINVSVGQIDTRTYLPACAAPEPFLPPGSRLWGKTTVGIRCSVPSPWTIYVPASVQVISEYLVTATPVAQGQMISGSEIAKVRGDLTALPPGIITDLSQAVGRTAAVSLAAGIPLRSDALRAQQAIQQGQTVRLVSSGPGFRVSAEARALNNAAEGQVAQARTASGQVVSGVARTGGVVEVTY
ncbi:MAG TPA: flagellar basal body P-ring formation chaperone FlgA [Noviherbaspirillum sp.]|uniref:flagellar basal body P-ring formation chaperone FlgA n=1 Tax=Noviherbaspirillum sp. TaxID=1926288 RepID=UPI002B497706|nr:flagellar basal body P-ring formation chaperone FlgA [Noviherbaspirillum sp.]HJV88479.1 flagellar basal body P-ring formation chaperone FlgA [Noviherbaspirillum sp.]